jgi:hypothetical protein
LAFARITKPITITMKSKQPDELFFGWELGEPVDCQPEPEVATGKRLGGDALRPCGASRGAGADAGPVELIRRRIAWFFETGTLEGALWPARFDGLGRAGERAPWRMPCKTL